MPQGNIAGKGAKHTYDDPHLHKVQQYCGDLMTTIPVALTAKEIHQKKGSVILQQILQSALKANSLTWSNGFSGVGVGMGTCREREIQ